MKEKLVYCVFRSSKGGKDLFAIFENADDAYYNAKLWKKEAEENIEYTVNYKVLPFTMYKGEA